MSALLNNLAAILQQAQTQKGPFDRKKPGTPNAMPGTLGYSPPTRPRGTLLSAAADTPVQPRKTLLGS